MSDARWQGGQDFRSRFAEKTARIGDLDIYYTDWNETGSRPVLMIHGINVQGHTWDPIASVFGESRRVICPDLRGHGRSSWARSGYFVKSFCDDLIGLLDGLGIRECDVIGHSLGARVAVALAGTWSGKVGHVVLSDSGPSMATAGLQRATKSATARVGRRGFNDAVEAMRLYEEIHAEWQPVFRELHVNYQLRENWAGKLIERSDPDLFWVTRSAGARDNDWLWEIARSLTMPVLLLWGARSEYFDDATVERYRREFPNFQDVRMDTGHYVPREKPGEFCAIVERFFAYAPPGGSSAAPAA